MLVCTPLGDAFRDVLVEKYDEFFCTIHLSRFLCVFIHSIRCVRSEFGGSAFGYEYNDLLHVGGNCVVFAASSGRVAVKVAKSAGGREQMCWEQKMLEFIRRAPGINFTDRLPEIIHSGTVARGRDSVPAVAMTPVGTPLRDLSPVASSLLATVGASVVLTLRDLHAVGVFHCDVSPMNIIVLNDNDEKHERRRAMLIDLGLAQFESATTLIFLEGTTSYLPREGGPSARSDVVMLGRTLLSVAHSPDKFEKDGEVDLSDAAALAFLVEAVRDCADAAKYVARFCLSCRDDGKKTNG